MSWVDLEPPAAGYIAKTQTPCAIGRTKGDKQRQRLYIIVREAPSWWKAGAEVNVSLGHGTEAGRLRITPKGGFVVKSLQAGTNGKQPALYIDPFPGAEGDKRSLTPCEYQHSDKSIEIELPVWARGASTVKPLKSPPPPIAQAPAAVPTGKPYRGELARTPDPTLARARAAAR